MSDHRKTKINKSLTGGLLERQVTIMKKSNAYQKHYEYMKNIAPKLLEAERIVDEIRESKEWKQAYCYFQVLYTRGQIKECPTRKNGYKIEENSNLVRLSDIEDILTEEQLEIIKGRL